VTTATRTTWLGPPPAPPARRIASLVPSLTEAAFMIGAGDRLVARTDFCTHPQDRLGGIEAVGGTKDPDVGRILALAPDLVLANREENTRSRIERLAETIPVWLTDPRAPEDAPALWRELGAVTGRAEHGAALATAVEAELDASHAWRAGRADGPRFLYLVWKDPWMVAGHDTYISRLLETAGLRNALPPGFDRFPRLATAALGALPADVHLFSSEPFGFELPRDLAGLGAGHRPIAAGVYRIASGALALGVDARPLSWYPSLTAAGLRAARELRDRLDGLART